MGKIIAVCSGCGGVGKSTVALSAALAAAKRGLQTILLDASGSARACDLMLGLESIVVLDMMDVVKQRSSLQTAIYPVPNERNLSFACASLYEGIPLSELSGVILALRAMSDLLVIDLPTGPLRIGQEVMDPDDILLLLTRPDDISIRALERTISAMPAPSARCCLIINRADPVRIRKKAQYPAKSVEMMLDMPAALTILEDETLHTGIGTGKPFIDRNQRLRNDLWKLLEQEM